MNFRPCIECSLPIYEGEARCSNCGKRQNSHKAVISVLAVFISVMCLLIGLSLEQRADSTTTSKTETIQTTTTPISTPTIQASPTPSPIAEIQYPAPEGEEWISWSTGELLYVRAVDCLISIYPESINTCQGKSVEFFLTFGTWWHIAWDLEGKTVYTNIPSGQIFRVEIPTNATSVHFSFYDPQNPPNWAQ